jgi:uncharacterized protein YodC (DUF2158 family)
MTEKCKVGDIVYLKSGSPAMKIIEFVPMLIRAEWDKGDGSKGREFFYPETVTKVPTPVEDNEEAHLND